LGIIDPIRGINKQKVNEFLKDKDIKKPKKDIIMERASVTPQSNNSPPKPNTKTYGGSVKANQSMSITYEDEAGKLITVGSSVKNLERDQEDIIGRGGYVVRVASGSKVFFEAERLGDYKNRVTSFYQSKYKISGYIPPSIEQQIRQDMPSSVRYLGLEKEYVRSSYERGVLGYNYQNMPEYRPPGFVGPIADPFSVKAQEKFSSLPDVKKFEFGFRFGDIGKEPVETWKNYPGGAEFLKKSSPGEKQEYIDDYIGRHGGYDKVAGRVIHDVGRSLFPSSFKETEYYTPSKSEIKAKTRSRVWEDITLTVPQIESSYWEKTPAPARWTYSYSHAFVSGLAFPITLPQAGVKLVTGKTWLLPDVGGTLGSIRGGSPSGIISTGFSEGIGKLTGNESDEWERFARDPVSGLFATAGEVFGIVGGGKAVHVGKVGSIRGLGKVRASVLKHTGVNLPGYASFAKYSPSNLVSTGWWKVKEKLGLVKYIPEEQYWDVNVLKGYKKFAEQKGAGRQLELFEKSRNLSSTGDILGVHATPSNFGRIIRIGKGSSESPGLSVSAFNYGSPHFLKVTGTSLSYETGGISLLPKFFKPGSPVIYLKNVFRIPKSLRKSGFDKSNKFILSQPKGPYAWIAPKSEIGGPEIEAIIRGGTWGRRISNSYYTSYKGVTVPVPQYKLYGSLPKGFVNTASASTPESVKSFFSISYSSGSKSIPIINPSYLLSRSLNVSSSSSVSKISMPKISFGSSKGFSSSSLSKSISSYSPSYSKNLSRSVGSSRSSSISSLSSSISKSYSSIGSSISSGVSSPSFSFSSSMSSPSVSPYPSYKFKYPFPSVSKKKTGINVKPSLLNPKYRYREFKIKSLDKLINKAGGGLF